METVNYYAPLIQAITTLFLVLITFFYACSTYKMQKLMQKQIVADLKLSNDFLEIKHVQDFTYQATLSFRVDNRNCASGSIDIPKLIIKSKDDGSELQVSENIDSEMIFVPGGGSRNMTLDYGIDASYQSLKDNINSLEFWINFTDNLGNPYNQKVTKVESEPLFKEIERRLKR